MVETYEDLPLLYIEADIQIYSNVLCSVELEPSSRIGPSTQRELDFQQFLEAVYKQIRDDNGGCLDIKENHFTNRANVTSDYIFGYYTVGKLTMFQYLVELRISDHSESTGPKRLKYFRKQANKLDPDKHKSHGSTDYKDPSNPNNAQYIPIDVNIHTKWVSNIKSNNSPDVNYLVYNSYQDALSNLPNDLISLLQNTPQSDVIGYKNHILYKTQNTNEYTVYTDDTHRNILISGTLKDVCNYIDKLGTSNQNVTSTISVDSCNYDLNAIATAIEDDLDADFPDCAPFHCAKAYIQNHKLIIGVFDEEFVGYTFEFELNTNYITIYREISKVFDETYQYDDYL